MGSSLGDPSSLVSNSMRLSIPLYGIMIPIIEPIANAYKALSIPLYGICGRFLLVSSNIVLSLVYICCVLSFLVSWFIGSLSAVVVTSITLLEVDDSLLRWFVCGGGF